MTTSQRVWRGALAVVTVALGVLLILRPFSSVPWAAAALAVGLIVAGAVDLADAEVRRSPLRLAAAIAMPIVGIVLLAWRGLSVFAVAVAAAVALVAWAIGRWGRALKRGPGWWADALLGVAAIAAAVLAISWPGVSIFLVMGALGIALIWRGVGALIGLFRSPDRTPRAHVALRTIGAVVAVVVTVPLTVATFYVRGTAPEPGAFYSATLPSNAKPGTLLKFEPTTQGVPDGARAWKILYTTTRGDRPALASGTVLVPTAPSTTPRPVIAWAHGTSGIAENCAPSMMAAPFAHIPGLAQVVQNGWVLVATDYIGMGTPGPSPYVIGDGEARSTLDSVRAARALPGIAMAPQTVVWGHSQGGHAALWTELLAPSYAPDVGVVATAALAPASDLSALAVGMESMAGGALLASYVLAAYDAAYPDVHFNDYLKVQARLPIRGMAERCLSSLAMPVSLAEALILGTDFYSQDPTSGPLGARLLANTPSARLPHPTFIAQGLADEVISPSSQNTFATQQCRTGSDLVYQTYPGLGHMTLIDDESPAVAALLSWTQARFAGQPQSPACPT
ncbi:lipase family protein [Gordonia phthalatica]|uniref:Lipase n=1 Tax=Gordonia phthalatica TaxID=1136941 RepID=A0A0N7FUX0_9ACTN|nr:lipase family protein [Gordonia phthalatica]ALG85535.1 hypothetical protein ACH46_14955 [Gordonia phthalatica]